MMVKIIKTKRSEHRKHSNNTENTNKNICTSAVAQYLGVIDNVRYLHCTGDVLRAVRTKYYAHSRLSKLGRSKTVGAIRKNIDKLTVNESGHILGFTVHVPGHVLFINVRGQTVIDTAPRLRDKRRVLNLYIVKSK